MEGATDVGTLIKPLSDALVASITPAQLVSILAGIVGVGMMFVLMWFGARKLKQIFEKDFCGSSLLFFRGSIWII